MGFWDLLTFLLVFVTILFVIMCASPEGDSFLNKLNRVVFIYIPKGTYRMTVNLLGIERTNQLKFYLLYIFTEQSPFFQLIYLALSLGGYTVFLHYGFPFMPNMFVDEYHIYIGSFLYFLALMSFFASCLASPGIIKKSNLKDHLKLFKYDNILYKPTDCGTCKFQRPARSKHCSICGYCISKHDHHCIWINQCVGYSNYKFFLMFILSHSIVCTYAGIVGFFIFMSIIKKEKLLTAVFTDSSGNSFDSTWGVIFQFLLQQFPAFMFVVILCLLMGLVLGGFFIYHLLMAGSNSTSSERVKKLRLPNEGSDVVNIYNLGFIQNLKEIYEASEF